MAQGMVKKLMCCLACGMLLLLLGCAKADNATQIVIFSIGKADAILLISGEHTVLIDAGESDDGEKILRYLEKRQITSLDAMIITHYDKDHVGGADTVLMGIPVYAVYDADYVASSKQYREYILAMQAAGVPQYGVTHSMTLSFGDLTLTILPTSLQTTDDNDNSLVVYANDPWHSFYFMADAEEVRIQELLAQGMYTADVIKMPHHGGYLDSLPALMETVKAHTAIITDSTKNQADAKTLALLAKSGVDTYQTKNGMISIVSQRAGIAVVQ